TAERLEDRRVQLGRTIACKQPQQRGCDGTEIVTALRCLLQQRLCCRRRCCETVDAAVCAGSTLPVGEGLYVSRVLDLGPFVVSAWMTGDHLGAVDDAHGVRIAEDGE